MKLVIEVKRRRTSVTQGEADVYVNGQKAVTFGDKIEMIKEGDRCYGENIGGWGSKKPDSAFITGYLWHPHDERCNYREELERILTDGEELEALGANNKDKEGRDERQKVLTRTDQGGQNAGYPGKETSR